MVTGHIAAFRSWRVSCHGTVLAAIMLTCLALLLAAPSFAEDAATGTGGNSATAAGAQAAMPAPSDWWVSAGPLLWWVKSAPLPSTLTTFAPGSPSATTGAGGELGIPGTSVLSPGHLGYGALPGARFTAGHWLDANQSWGVEAEGFFLGDSTASFSDASNGTPPLRIPFTNVPPGAGFPLGSSSFVLASPGFAAGGQSINSSLLFWGVESNAVFAPNLKTGPIDLSFLAGLRYLDLSEGLSIVSNETLLAPGNGAFTGTDSFATKNRFLGPQLGVKAEMGYGPFDGFVLAKLALGDNLQSVSINGSSVVSGFGFPATPTTFPGGVFAQSTNIGHQSRNAFAVLPEMRVQLGYKLPYGLRPYLAYDFLFLSSAVRPGNQIDTTLNLTGSPAISPGSTLTGAARPQPQFNSSTFWAQGIQLGLKYEF